MENKLAARCMAMIHNLVIAILNKMGFSNHAQARRAFDANPSQAINLLLEL